MEELTDLEICKKIAEIEGLESDGGDPHRIHIEVDGQSRTMQWDPLGDCAGDKALCFDLMIEYGIELNYTACPAGSGTLYFANTPSNLSSDYCESPSKAICLAIIKAH